MIATNTASCLAQYGAVALRGYGKDGTNYLIYRVDQLQNDHMLPVFAGIRVAR
jgi:hypothetical protein